ncbi:MAG TPA: branched-chain amino acid aminotransferase [Stellaceae bacterium]|nr:branched-chain amino acid aminotransferase [Stellaceae bacterium]
MFASQTQSKTWTFFEEEWCEGNVPIMGSRTHAAWLGSSVFDGARAFGGMAPDLDLHFKRVNESARRMNLNPSVRLDTWLGLAAEGISRFAREAELYIRPMYWAQDNGLLAIAPDPESTRWCLAVYEAPMPEPLGFSITLSPYRRPASETMPVDAKAGCLYPNNARAILEAKARGFDNCVMRDMLGNVAELANSNIFMVKRETVLTPIGNGTFLTGITRGRVIAILRAAGVQVAEMTLSYEEFRLADEIFSTGNYGKVLPVTRIDDRMIEAGPVCRMARELYWAFARASASRGVVGHD